VWLASATSRRPESWEDIQMNFKKSSFSGAVNPNCVEVGFVAAEVLLRNSRDRHGLVLHFTPEEWKAFIAGAKAGEFDLN
jgi:hypothetical protein